MTLVRSICLTTAPTRRRCLRADALAVGCCHARDALAGVCSPRWHSPARLVDLASVARGAWLPMVVVPHGGPYDIIDVRAFDAEADIQASQGYAVLRVNFRGSGGYGRAFNELGYRQWGPKMQDDLSDATRHVADAGIADADRICIYGASHGGYAALMGAIREPDLYRCAASYAAPTDLSKLYKWGSIRRTDLGKRYLERVIGKDEADLAARSPVDLAISIKVPVLVAHGRLDACRPQACKVAGQEVGKSRRRDRICRIPERRPRSVHRGRPARFLHQAVGVPAPQYRRLSSPLNSVG